MNTKLTLTIDKSIISSAKEYAKNTGRSLSDITENFYKSLSKKTDKVDELEILPRIKAMKGSFKISENIDYKEELEKALEEKYK